MQTVVRENQCSKFSPICNCTQNTFSFLKQGYVTKRLGNAGVCQLPCEILSRQTGWFWRKFRKPVYEVFLLCSVPHSIFLWLEWNNGYDLWQVNQWFLSTKHQKIFPLSEVKIHGCAGKEICIFKDPVRTCGTLESRRNF